MWALPFAFNHPRSGKASIDCVSFTTLAPTDYDSLEKPNVVGVLRPTVGQTPGRAPIRKPGIDSASVWHFEPILVDFEPLDFRIKRSCRQP